MVSVEILKKYLKSDVSVKVYEELVSTSLTAKELYNGGLRENALIVAQRQSGGRGRMGRSFYSPEGGLYMSLLLADEMSSDTSLCITTAAAVAVCRAIDAIAGDNSQIKWVNDVYRNGKKVCGILTEGKVNVSGQLEYAILGIGANLTQPKDGFPQDIANRAGALFDSSDNHRDCRLAAEIVDGFMEIYKKGLCKSLYVDEYRSRSLVVGKTVDVMRIHDGTSEPAEVIGIGDDFGLTVRFSDGRTETLHSGDVSLRI